MRAGTASQQLNPDWDTLTALLFAPRRPKTQSNYKHGGRLPRRVSHQTACALRLFGLAEERTNAIR